MRKSAAKIQDFIDLWKSEKQRKVKGKNDILEKNKGGISYYLFGNEIAFYNPDKNTLLVKDAGWQSATTKERLHNLMYPFNLGITQKNYVWFLIENLTGDWTFKKWTGEYLITKVI